MASMLYPPDAPIPAPLVTDRAIVRPLRPEDAEQDYAAVMAARAHYAAFNPGDWPPPSFSLEQDRADLVAHQADFAARRNFTLGVMAPNGSACFGSIYVNPLAKLLARCKAEAPLPDFTPEVYFWVVPAAMELDLDRALFPALERWLSEDWAFSRVSFQTYAADARQVDMLEDAGLVRDYTLEIPNGRGQYYVYGRPR